MFTKLIQGKKLTTIIIGVLFFTTIVLLLIQIRKGGSPNTANIPITNVSPLLKEPNNLSFDFSNASDDVKVPDKEYQVRQQNLNKETLLKKFGLDLEAPLQTNKDSTRYLWKENSKSLILSIERPFNTVFFTSKTSENLSPPALPFSQANSLATQYIQEKLDLPPNVSLQTISQNYSLTQGNSGNILSEPTSANTTNITYGYTIDGFPLHLSDRSAETIKVIIGSDGEIIQLFYYVLPELISTNNQNTIPPEKAIKTISQGGGILFQTTPNLTFEGPLVPDYTTIKVQNIKPAYLYDPNLNLTRLTYEISGIAQDSNDSNLYYGVVYLTPAKEY